MFSDNAYERSRQALLSLMTFDPKNAARAVVGGATSVPPEAHAALSKIVGEKTAKSPVGAILSTATNPFVLLGLGLALRYPVGSLENLGIFAERFKQLGLGLPGSRYLFDVYENFKGTNVPGILAKLVGIKSEAQIRGGEAVQTAIENFIKETGAKPSANTLTKVVAHLDGLGDPANPLWEKLAKEHPDVDFSINQKALELNPAEAKLVDQYRKTFQGIRNYALENARPDDPQKIRRLLNSLGVHTIDDVKTYENYFPHVAVRGSMGTPYSRFDENEDALSAFGLKRRTISETEAAAVGRPSKNLRKRFFKLVPDAAPLLEAGIISPEAAAAMEASAASRGKYSLDLFHATEKYNFGMATTKAWMVPYEPNKTPLGDLLLNEYQQLRKGEVPDKVRAAMLEQTYIPLATGQMTPQQAIAADRFDQMKLQASRVLEKLPIPSDLKGRMTRYLTSPTSPTWNQFGGSVSSYFYTSTLGGNLPSAGINALQSLVTTIPMIGTEATGKGFSTVMSRVGKMSELMAKGQPIADAFDAAFHEFTASGFDVTAPIVEHIEGVYSAQGLTASTGRQTAAKIRDALMVPFSTTERMNRLTAFYGTFEKALKDLPGKAIHDPITGERLVLPVDSRSDEVRKYAQYAAEHVARQTQFGGGLLSTPYGLLGHWKPFTQFMQFPLKMTGYALGAGLNSGGVGFNPGTLGRAMLGSGLTYEIGKNVFGRDWSKGLLTGGMPYPRDSGPWAPSGVVPPVLQIAGALGMDAASGSLDETRKVLPLLVPGGVALSRASVAAPPVAKALGRPYADYRQVTPDGRIGVYTKTGILQGYYSPTQLAARAMGFGDVQGQQEQVLAEWLAKNADNVRGIRQQYINGIIQNDPGAVADATAQYEAEYPNTGGLPVKQADIEAAKVRRDMPRLQQMVQQLPPGMRESFAAVIGTAYGAASQQFLGADFGASVQRASGSVPTGPLPNRNTDLPTAGPTPQPLGMMARTAVDAGKARRDSMKYSPLQGY